MLENLDIYRAARLLIDNHGARASAYAAAWVRALRESGNERDASMLDRVMAAIEHLLRVGHSVKRPRIRQRARRRSRAKVVQISTRR